MTQVQTYETPDAAYEAFLAAYPEYRGTAVLDEIRARDFARLDAQHHVYLDYTGAGLYATSQLQHHVDLLRTRILGNPHSHNPPSAAATELVDAYPDPAAAVAERVILRFCSIPESFR